MRCSICGAETGDALRVCDRCRQAQAEVQVLTPDERDRFTGITIDAGEKQRDYNQSHHAGRGVFIRHITLGWRGGWLTKLAIAAVLAAIVFVVLPLGLMLAGAFALGWLLFRFLRR
ncbi:hypothetical protein [Sporolituus thermophilus]|uniref:Zinc-ribbon domain-containing protein n=1 Tax=Sporolituus thermophilus DSM 23256 TaxID=1123285 RepID=A0A1G7KI13_9FIRM|nr:hypothetical protein [Sporolituus thermophilus]SDF36741.1 hypothetical protein SAMN05660235_01347 [Sporolituus thermophilus DSM 23256]